jgi:hypothetical protein
MAIQINVHNLLKPSLGSSSSWITVVLLPVHKLGTACSSSAVRRGSQKQGREVVHQFPVSLAASRSPIVVPAS